MVAARRGRRALGYALIALLAYGWTLAMIASGRLPER